MRAESTLSGASIDRCSRCGGFGSGSAWSFGYGTPIRISQRSGEDIDGYLGTETVFLCSACQRALLWSGFREFVKRHPSILLPLAGVAVSFLIYGWFPELILNQKVLAALAFAALGCAWLAFRWSRRHAPTMQRLCFEFRRPELVAKAKLGHARLSLYPPR